MKKLFAVAASLALAIGLAGCPATSFERTAYQTLAATQAIAALDAANTTKP